MNRFSGFSLFLMFLHLPSCFTQVAEVSVTAAVGVDLVLPCSGRDGVKVKVLEWTRLDQRSDLLIYRAGKVLHGYEHPNYTNRVQLLHPQLHSRDLSVVLNRVTREDSGTYRCYAFYEDGQEKFQSIHLTVKGQGYVAVAAEGEDCVLRCSSLLGPEVSGLMWTDEDGHLLLYRGGNVLNGYEDSLYTNRVQLLDPQLHKGDLSVVLKEVTLKDSGMYRCEALYEDGQRIFRFSSLRVTEQKQDKGDRRSSGLSAGLCLVLVIAVLCCFSKRRLTRLFMHLTRTPSAVMI